MGVSRYNIIQADQFLGSQAEASPFGKIWYVDGTNGSDGNLGDGPGAGEAFATIGAAISAAVATRGDHVVIYPGTYTITSALAPKAFMTFKAAILNPQAPSVSIRGNIQSLVTVDVNGCRFIGLEFRATGALLVDLVRLADTTAITGGATFEDCVFNGADQTGVKLANDDVVGVIGVNATDASNAVTGLVIRRCLFRDLGISPLAIGVNGMPYAKIEDNVFAIDSVTGCGIDLANTTAFATGKGFTIRQNEFIGPSSVSSTTIGIVIHGTEDAVGAGMIRDNYFSYCAVNAITRDKMPDGVINNYVGATNGGNIIDSEA